MSLPSAKELAHRLAGVAPMMTAAEFQVRLETELVKYAEAVRQACRAALVSIGLRGLDALDLTGTGTSPRKETP